jgi:hypothetical protein
METFSFTALDLHGIHPTFIMACRLTGDIYNSSAVWLMLDEATRVTAEHKERVLFCSLLLVSLRSSRSYHLCRDLRFTSRSF